MIKPSLRSCVSKFILFKGLVVKYKLKQFGINDQSWMSSMERGQAFLHPVVANLRNAAIPQKAHLLFIPFISLPPSILSVPTIPLTPLLSFWLCCVSLRDDQRCSADRAGQWAITSGTIAVFVKIHTDGVVWAGMW